MGWTLAAGLALSACTPTGGVIDSVGTPSGGRGGAAAGAAGLSATGTGGASGAAGMTGEPMRPPGPPPARCESSTIGARALLRLTAGELAGTLRDVFPEAKTIALGISDPLDSKDGFVNPGKLVFGEDSAEKLMNAARGIADAMVTAPAGQASPLGAKFPCIATTPNAACAGEVIKRYGRRLFRRSLTAEEQQRYTSLASAVAAKSDFAQGLKWALVSLMQSPHTLYRRQLGQPAGAGIWKLTPIELASELAYTFTGTAPSEELLAKAERGGLASREALVSEARALLQTPPGRAALGEFFRLWLGYDLVTANQRDRIPGFAGLRDKLAEETRAFIDQVVHTDKGGIAGLLTAPYTMVDGALGTYYGFARPAGSPDFARTMRTQGQGVGLLAQGSILAERSQSLNSSPTRRGILVRHKLLCLEIPQQPMAVPDLPPAGAGWKTTRQRFESVHSQGGCASCHTLFDPFGFPLEHFDEGGRYRATENGEPIDASATVYADFGQALFSIKGGQEELSSVLAARPEVGACAAETLVKYLMAQDRDCLAADARNDFVAGKIGFLDLAAGVAGAPHFSERRTSAP